jgi:alkylation response protein AidB-like acyl-CoA dehydrogenase
VDLRDTQEEAAFRAELRAWLEANLPEGKRGGRGGSQRFDDPFGREWSRMLYEGGYAGLTWPKEYGGAGAPYSFQAIFYEEMARAQAPAHIGVIGLGMAGPTIMAHGTDEQKQEHLSKILSAEEIWCQGFSEPGAGSDLAAARTSAERRGDVYVVNGQKVWSSFAHIADFCILVTLSDPDAKRYHGLTYLIVDMRAPGVEVRPLRQITGEAEFNEIFFNDVEVPVSNRLGEEGEGWQVAMTTLLHERGTLGFALTAALEVGVDRLLDVARERVNGDATLRERVARGVDRVQALRYTNYRSLGTLQRTGIPPGGLGDQAALVAEPAHDEARRAARPGRDPRRRLVAPPAAAQPRQHDRGRHVGSAPQHRRRARARPPEEQVMDFAFNEDQLELKRQARAWLSERYPLDRDWDAPQDDRWAELAELGWLGVSVAKDEGGVGLGFVEEAILIEELGYALYPGPYLATVGFALAALGPEDRTAVAAGETKWSAEVNGLVPWLLSVDKVVDADGNAQEARGEELVSVDPSRPLGRLERTNGTPLPAPRDVPRARAAMAAEAVGIAQRVLELGIEHAKTREQFGKPIGVSSGGVPPARTRTPTELARSLAYWSAWCVPRTTSRRPSPPPPRRPRVRGGRQGSERSIQVHGGTGFTWEHPLHRFYKRALWLEGFGSRPSELRLEVPPTRCSVFL